MEINPGNNPSSETGEAGGADWMARMTGVGVVRASNMLYWSRRGVQSRLVFEKELHSGPEPLRLIRSRVRDRMVELIVDWWTARMVHWTVADDHEFLCLELVDFYYVHNIRNCLHVSL